MNRFVHTCLVRITNNNATPIRDLIVGFILTCVQDGKRFKHILYLQHDAVIGKIFNVERRISGENPFRRFFEAIDCESGQQ